MEPPADLRLDALPPLTFSAIAAFSEESGVTADLSGTSLIGDACSLPPSMEWTDEKHDRFLDLLERSFVDQLNDSKRSRGATLPHIDRRPYPLAPPELPLENCSSFDEVKQGGFRQQISLQSMQNTSYSCAVKSPRDLPKKEDGTSVQHSVYAEVSDQNFVAHGKTFACSSVSKRSRRNSPAGSSNDQVVPSGEIYKARRSPSRYAASSDNKSCCQKTMV